MTTNHPPSDEPDYARVRPGNECPQCGEDAIDSLVWVDDNRVRCGTVYDPNRPDAGA